HACQPPSNRPSQETISRLLFVHSPQPPYTFATRRRQNRPQQVSLMMTPSGRTWQQELDIIDRAMKAISTVTDPDELVGVYWDHIGDLIPLGDYMALSRRGVEPP